MSDVIVIGAMALTIVLCAWEAWCIGKTGRQRRRLIDACAKAIRRSNYEIDYWPALESVSFDRHLWLLTTLRNPWAEYVGLPPAFLAEAVQ